MHSKVAMVRHSARLERVLDALARELIESTDEELLEAARDLGMDPMMPGSAAFLGIKYPAMPGLSDFFEMPVIQSQRVGTATGAGALLPSGKRPRGRAKKRK